MGQSWMLHAIIYLYTLSILFYFSDFLNSNRQANRLAFWLLAAVWAMQTTFFVNRMMVESYFPVVTLFESLFFYSWVLVTLSLVINYFFKIDFFVFFTNLIGFAMLALNLFTNPDAPPRVSELLISDLLVIHITLAFLGYGAFSLSFIFSVMYLIQHRLLKEKKWNHKLRRLPSLSQLDLYSYRLNMLGVPVLLVSIILGFIWAYLKLDRIWMFWLDPKVLLSIVVLLVFSLYLYQRVVKKQQGLRLVFWNVGAFMIMIINFLISDSVSSFHRWF
ncbi:MAG: cytochrome c biogenesis protein CcsA [Bacillaceae bacterium]|nr:cytochrome c biogenesis protein CcsA [Bacillaceae bacterium]